MSALWLAYGVDSSGALIHVDETPRGKSALVCPYCAGGLVAKKGQRVAHHFAHIGTTCHPAARTGDLPTIPLYDNFNLHLTGKELAALTDFHAGRDTHLKDVLKQRGLIRWNQYKHTWGGGWELTKTGKIPFGDLSLLLFCQIQEPLIAKRHAALAEMVEGTWRGHAPPQTVEERLTDLRIYRAQLQRILRVSLYFLAIEADGQTFHKIGVTGRSIDERLAELRHDLAAHFQQIAITVLGVWPHRGNVELYFKHRYKKYQAVLGSLTEYFRFDDVTSVLGVESVLRDLRRMPKKALTPDERALVDGAPAAIELAIATARAAEEQARAAAAWSAARSEATRTGIAAAKARGVRVGRPADTDVLAKPANQSVIAALQAGLSLRQAATAAGVAINTVRKVKAALADVAIIDHADV